MTESKIFYIICGYMSLIVPKNLFILSIVPDLFMVKMRIIPVDTVKVHLCGICFNHLQEQGKNTNISKGKSLVFI